MSGGLLAQSFVLNCIPSRDPQSDWTWQSALEAGAVAPIKSIDLPASVDLRDPDWCVRSQKDTGACVGFATADGLLRYHFAKKGTITFKDMPSPRFIWMADKETDSITDYPTTFIESVGTEVKRALQIAHRYGFVLEEDLPIAGPLWQGTQEAFYMKAAQFRIIAYNSLGTDPKIWRKWLATGGPILTRLNVDASFCDATKTNGELTAYDPSSARGGHAVCLVGYREDGSFIVRNSWGPDWGDQGFAYSTPSYTQLAFTEAYGIVV